MTVGVLELEKRVAKEVRRFSIDALIEQIVRLGYRPEDIRFRSVHSYVSQASLVRKITFQRMPRKRVTIYVNFGLLSAQSPLPSYFFKHLDTGILDNESFEDFLAYFDHQIIKNYLLGLYPELNTRLFQDWEHTKRHFLSLIDIRAPSTLKWLFDLVFPELGIEVEKAVLGRGLTNEPIVLGQTKIGSDAVFGRRTKVPVNGIRATLTSDTENYRDGTPWPEEINERLERDVYPHLRSVGMDIEVLLVIRAQKSFAKLHVESYLGYDKIRGGKENYRRIKIFSGHLQETGVA